MQSNLRFAPAKTPVGERKLLEPARVARVQAVVAISLGRVVVAEKKHTYEQKKVYYLLGCGGAVRAAEQGARVPKTSGFSGLRGTGLGRVRQPKVDPFSPDTRVAEQIYWPRAISPEAMAPHHLAHHRLQTREFGYIIRV